MNMKGTIAAYVELTKQDEIEAFRAFIESVPRSSYLADYLRGALDDFANLVRLDISHPTLAETWRDAASEQRQHAEQSKALRAELDAARKELRDTERARDRARAELDEIRAAARRVLSS